MLVLRGVKQLSEMLWLSGVSSLTLRLSSRVGFPLYPVSVAG